MIIVLGVFSLIIWLLSWQKIRTGQSLSNTYWLCWLGIFVWADALIIAPFWIVATILWFLSKNASLFGLITSLFWVIRGSGEILYWFLEQFTTKHHNPPATLVGYRFIKDETLWFLYQVFWQCVTVFSVIATLYFAHAWLN